MRTKSASTEPLIIFNRSQACVIVKETSHLAYKPPPALCTKAEVAKGGGIFAGHYGILGITVLSCGVELQ